MGTEAALPGDVRRVHGEVEQVAGDDRGELQLIWDRTTLAVPFVVR